MKTILAIILTIFIDTDCFAKKIINPMPVVLSCKSQLNSKIDYQDEIFDFNLKDKKCVMGWGKITSIDDLQIRCDVRKWSDRGYRELILDRYSGELIRVYDDKKTKGSGIEVFRCIRLEKML